MRFIYHHCMSIKDVSFKEIVPDPVYSFRKSVEEGLPYGRSTTDYCCDLHANWWLEKQFGFYPLFLAVGHTYEDINMSGYPYQWSRIVSTSYDQERKKTVHVLRKPGEFRNDVLFSYENLEGVRFVDYDYWFWILNACLDDPIPEYVKRLVIKPSWNKADWLRKARKEPHHVMGVIPRLDLRLADRIWVRNASSAKLLADMGFNKVKVKRMRKPKW